MLRKVFGGTAAMAAMVVALAPIARRAAGSACSPTTPTRRIRRTRQMQFANVARVPGPHQIDVSREPLGDPPAAGRGQARHGRHRRADENNSTPDRALAAVMRRSC